MSWPPVVVMGVSGSGKTTVGEALARSWEVDFSDADEFHPPENIAKMSAGTPLTDADRQPWLAAIGAWLWQHRDGGAVATCSALRRSYRDNLRDRAGTIWFLYLEANHQVLEERLRDRPHHFMPASLLDSQLETLEPPEPDEDAVVVEATQSPGDIVAQFTEAVRNVCAKESDV